MARLLNWTAVLLLREWCSGDANLTQREMAERLSTLFKRDRPISERQVRKWLAVRGEPKAEREALKVGIPGPLFCALMGGTRLLLHPDGTWDYLPPLDQGELPTIGRRAKK